MTIDLANSLTGPVWAYLLVFARIGAVCMLFPGLGEIYVNTKARLMVALAISLLLFPLLQDKVPALPAEPADLLLLLAAEVVIGIYFGSILRLLMSTLETAGTIISLQIGLSNAQIFNPAMAAPGTLTGAMLGAAGVLLIFVSGLYGVLLQGVVGTYELFPVGQGLPVADMQEGYVKMLAKSFALGGMLAAPFLIIGLLIGVVMGIMAKLMPQLQIFTLALPVQILTGLALFAATFSGILLIWMQQTADKLYEFQLI